MSNGFVCSLLVLFKLEPRAGFSAFWVWLLNPRPLPYQGNALGWVGIYQAEPPGHVVDAAALDMLYELLEARRVSRYFTKGGPRGKLTSRGWSHNS